MYRGAVYSCPDCGSPWGHKLVWRHTRWTPIVCPQCKGRFHFERKRWRQILLPTLISIAVLSVVSIAGKYFLGRTELLVVFSLVFAAFIISGIWWLYAVFTKLKFERHVET
jgi:hypothetical protein